MLNHLDPQASGPTVTGLQRPLPEHQQALRDFIMRAMTILLVRSANEGARVGVCSLPLSKYCAELCTQVMQNWSDLLEFCITAGDWPTDPTVTSSTTLDVKASVLRMLQHSVGGLLMLILTYLYSCPVSLVGATLTVLSQDGKSLVGNLV